jgi:hypothetical protein
MTRPVLYFAHPLRPTEVEIAACRADALDPEPVATALRANLARAQRWFCWLRRSFPETTFIAPWISAVLSGEDDSDPVQREAGLVDACAVIERCDGMVLCGGRVSSGMLRELRHTQRWWDLTCFLEPPDGGAPGGFVHWAAMREVRR